MDIKNKLKQAILRNYLVAACEPDWTYIGILIERRLALIDGLLALWLAGSYDDHGDDWLLAQANRMAAVACHPGFPVTRTYDNFAREVRAQVRGLWAGEWDKFTFVDNMVGLITRGFRQAWLEGAASCGVEEADLTEEELAALETATNEQFQYLPGFADAIEAGSEANGGDLQALLTRAEMWIARYRDVWTRGAAMACADSKAEWRLGPTKESCRSCAGFNGRVYRYSIWLKNGAIPGAYVLCCHGFRCKCSLESTSAKGTGGAFPRGLLCGGRSLLARVKEAVVG